MGNPAVCPLTPLPPTVMSVPIAFRVTSAGRGCDTSTQETHSCDDVHMCTQPIHTHIHTHTQARRWMMYAGLHTRWQPKNTRVRTHLQLTQQTFAAKDALTQVTTLRRNVGQCWNHSTEEGRAGGLQTRKVCQRWHQQKQYYRAERCSWFGLLTANKAHYPLSMQFYSYTKNESLSFDECLKDTHNYPEMRVFIILWSLKPNAKRRVSSKEPFVLFAIMLHYWWLRMSPSVRNSSETCGFFFFFSSGGKAASLQPPTTTTTTSSSHETSKRGHTETSSPFWHCPPTSRSSNYSSYKTSTLLLVKPQYNNTTKHFKETTHISRGK